MQVGHIGDVGDDDRLTFNVLTVENLPVALVIMRHQEWDLRTIEDPRQRKDGNSVAEVVFGPAASGERGS